MTESLGTLTKSATSDYLKTAAFARRRRYAAQETASQLLPGHRVSTCGWRPIQGGQIGISRRDGRHYVSHAAVCGSVWACPVCASKIAAQRSQELQRAVEAWEAQGGAVWMLTLTINHVYKDSLDSLLSRFTEAMRKLWAGRWSKDWREAHGQVGIVRNIEVTWGAANGWHPHCHALVFVGAHRPRDKKGKIIPGAPPVFMDLNTLDVKAAELDLKHRWQAVAARFGFEVSIRRGASLDATKDGKAAADYVTKDDDGSSWGVAQELTWANIKHARGERFTPFALLAACDSPDVGAAPALFQEYADTFKGRRQLYWSKGLRDLLGLNAELSDEDVANAHDEQSTFVCAIGTSIFCWLKARGLLCDLLEAADDGGLESINSFLEWAYDCRMCEASERRLMAA